MHLNVLSYLLGLVRDSQRLEGPKFPKKLTAGGSMDGYFTTKYARLGKNR